MSYKTTFRALQAWNNLSTPNSFEHRLFATSDNKLVFIHDSDKNGFACAVTVADGTTDPYPTILAGSATTGSPAYEQQGTPNQNHEQTIQLTDTRYARIADVAAGFTSLGTEIQIIDVNLTTGASSIVARYDVTNQFDNARLISHFDVANFARGSGYTDGVQVLEVDADPADVITRAQVTATISGGQVQTVNDLIVDGGEYASNSPFNPGNLIGAGGDGLADLSSPNFATNRTNSERDGKQLFRISDTLFGFFFINNGTNYNSSENGSLNVIVFEDLGASIGVKMAKTEIYDVTAPANNGGNPRSSMREFSCDYINTTDRIFVIMFQQSYGGSPAGSGFNPNRDGAVIAAKFNATYTGLETIGAVEVAADTYANSQILIRRVDDTHALLLYDSGLGLDDPLSARLIEINPTTLAITVGAELFPAGPPEGDWRDSTDEGQVLVLSSTRALWVYGIEDAAREQAAGSITINQEPFDNTQDLRTADRFVDTFANITTAWPTPGFSQIVCTVDTGLTYKWNNVDTWELMTVNQNRRDYYGLYVQEFILDTTTNTVTLGKSESLVNEQFPRWESDGAGGVQKTGIHTERASAHNQIVLLPNGKIVISAFPDSAYNEDAPFLNETDYNGRGALEDGMGYWVQYFDPDQMP
jgi:hypothetical protein